MKSYCAEYSYLFFQINVIDSRRNQFVRMWKPTEVGQNSVSVPVIDLPSGLYFVQVKNKDQLKTQKFFVIR